MAAMPNYARLLETAAAACVAVLLACLRLLATRQNWSVGLLAGAGMVSSVSILLLCTCLFLRRRRPCETLEPKAFLLLSLMSVAAATVGRLARRRALKLRTGRQIRRAQEEALLRLVGDARRSKFGEEHGFGQIGGIDDFRQRVPVRQYADFREYTELTDRGLPNILYEGSVDFLCKTSGTTGRNKTLPNNRVEKKRLLRLRLDLMACNEAFKRRCKRPGLLGKALTIRVLPEDRKNEHGVPIGPVSKFYTSGMELYTLPSEALLKVHDPDVCMLLQCIFALWHERIDYVEVSFPTLALTFMRCLTENFDEVTRSIEFGRLPSSVTQRLPHSLTDRLTRRLTPKPERARNLRRLFENGANFENFFLKAWPEVSFVAVVRGGSFEPAYRHLRRRYLGDLPAFCSMLCSTEGLMGMNYTASGITDEEGDRFLPSVNFSFVEFLPLNSDGDDVGEPVLVHEMQEGVQYETVITSRCCWRLRVGDIVTVVEKLGDMPVIRMMHRKSHTLTVHVEKTSEQSLKVCALAAGEKIGRQIVGFTAADFATFEAAGGDGGRERAKYYVIFVELDSDVPLTDKQKLEFDRALRDCNENYDLFRSDGCISQMLTLQLRVGGLEALKESTIRRNPDTSVAQYKTPSVLKSEQMVKDLMAWTV